MLGTLLKIAALLAVVYYGVRFLHRIFKQQGKVYYLTPMRQLSLVFWSLMSFWLALSMFGLLIRDQTDTDLEKYLASGLGLVLFLFALPTLLLHFQYWRHEHKNAMELEKSSGTALLLQPGQKYLLSPATIASITETKCRSKSYFWSSYTYVTISLRDGRTVQITSLLLDLQILKAMWPRVPLQTKTKWACFL